MNKQLRYLVMNPVHNGFRESPMKLTYIPRFSYYEDGIYWEKKLEPIKTYIIPNDNFMHDVRNYGIVGFILK